MFTPVMLTLTSAVLAAILDWILIFGHFGIPPMGLQGAAYALLISRSIVLCLSVMVLYRTTLKRSVTRLSRASLSWIGRVLALGIPAGLQSILRTGAGMVYFSFLGRTTDGKEALAALTIGLGIEALAYQPGFAFSAAAAAMVGQNLGARKPSRAARAGWACTQQCMLVMTVMAASFYIFAPDIARWFSRDATVIDLTVAYLRINALSQPFIAMSMTLSGALQGAGDTRSPTVVTFFFLWMVRLPLTYWLAVHLGYGAVAAWWTMSGSMMISGLGIWLVYASGRWKDIQL